jgi:hypothetical protein
MMDRYYGILRLPLAISSFGIGTTGHQGILVTETIPRGTSDNRSPAGMVFFSKNPTRHGQSQSSRCDVVHHHMLLIYSLLHIQSYNSISLLFSLKQFQENTILNNYIVVWK